VATTVIVRVLTEAKGSLHPKITKNLLEASLKILLQFCEQEGEESMQKMASRTHRKDQEAGKQTAAG
jgi:hypothetical protein